MINTKKRDYVWNFIGAISLNILSPILLVLITWMNGISDSGLFSYAMSVALILWVVGVWGGRTYQVSDTKGTFAIGSYVATRVLLAIFMIIIGVIFCVINGYNPNKSLVIITLVSYKALESVADTFYGIMQTEGRLYLSGVSILIKLILSLVIFTLIDIFTGNLFLASLGLLISNILMIILFDLAAINIKKDFRNKARNLHIGTKNALALLRVTAPAFVIMILSMMSLNIPRYFVDKFHGDEIGYFGIIAMPIALIGIVVAMIMQTNILELTNMLESGKAQQLSSSVNRLLSTSVLAGIVLLLITAIGGIWLLNTLFNLDFTKYYFDLLILVLGGIAYCLVSILATVLLVARRFRMQITCLAVTNILLLIVSPFLIGSYSVTGASTLFAITNIVQFIWIYSYFLRVPKNSKSLNQSTSFSQ